MSAGDYLCSMSVACCTRQVGSAAVPPQAISVHHFRLHSWTELYPVDQIINFLGHHIWSLPKSA